MAYHVDDPNVGMPLSTNLDKFKMLTTVLSNLESCGFIRKYTNYGCTDRKTLYQLVDFFTLFYFRFLRDSSFRNLQYWSTLQQFSEDEFSISKDYDKVLRNKIVRFLEETKTRKSIQLTFVTSYGVKKGMYAGIVQNEVLLDDLFG